VILFNILLSKKIGEQKHEFIYGDVMLKNSNIFVSTLQVHYRNIFILKIRVETFESDCISIWNFNSYFVTVINL